MTAPRPLTVREAAARAGVSEALVRDWVAGGQLAHYRLGRRPGHGKILIEPADLERFLASRRVEARETGPAPTPAPLPGGREYADFHRRIMAEVLQKQDRRRQRHGR